MTDLTVDATIDQVPGASRSERDPAIFVSGFSRSGTTMLQGLICNSAETIPSTRECSYLRGLIEAYYLASSTAFSKHAIDYFNSNDEIREFHRKILDLYFDQIRGKYGDRLIVQKEPRLLAYFPELVQLMPRACFVVTVRDPRDILASELVRQKRNGVKQFAYKQWFQQQVSRFNRVLDHRQRLAGQLIFVRYESLCWMPRETLLDLQAALAGCLQQPIDLRAGPGNLSWETRRAGDESATELDSKPPSPEAVGRWRERLSQDMTDFVTQVRQGLCRATGQDWFVADEDADAASTARVWTLA